MDGMPLWIKIIVRLGRPGRVFLRPLRKFYYQYRRLRSQGEYHAWAVRNEEECFVRSKITKQTSFSIVVPVYNPKEDHLLHLVYSVVNQHYENWELILVNASTDLKIAAVTLQCADIDVRIKVITPKENLGISDNTNEAIKVATGDYIVFSDHDDTLHACALHSIAHHISERELDLVYTDEDKISHDGNRYFGPHCKPSWSPDLLRNVNYINHLTAIKRAYVQNLNGLRPSFDGAQDYDLLLRVVDKFHPKIGHVPHVLYHWRAAHSSTALDISNKTYIFKAGKGALREHLQRNGLRATVKAIKNRPGFYKIFYEQQEPFSLIVGPVEKQRQRVCAGWLKVLLAKQSYKKNIEVVVGDWFKPYASKNKKVSFVYIEENESKGEYWKRAISKSTHDTLLCFQEAAIPIINKSLSELAAISQNHPKNIISPIIVGADTTIFDAGLVESSYGLQKIFNGYKFGEGTFFGSTEWVRNTASLTLDIFATTKTTFLERINLDHNDKLCSKYLLPTQNDHRYVLWAHTPFIFSGMLSPRSMDDDHFNRQLSYASYEIGVKTVFWGEEYERADD